MELVKLLFSCFQNSSFTCQLAALLKIFGVVFFPHLEWQIIIFSKKVQGKVNSFGGHSNTKFDKSDKGL